MAAMDGNLPPLSNCDHQEPFPLAGVNGVNGVLSAIGVSSVLNIIQALIVLVRTAIS